jgi:hypothetical protein
MLWFKHRSDARNSLKLRKVRRKYGADGYAIYWFCLEAIAYDVDKDNLTFELKEDAETIGFELSVQESRVMEIMQYMVKIGLFESSSNMITCMKLAESMDKSMTNSPKMRKWLDGKKLPVSGDVMTLADDAKTCPELEVEVEVEKEVEIEIDDPKKSPPKKAPAKKNKTKFPADFSITKEMFDWFVEKQLTIDIESATEKWVLSMQAGGYSYVDWGRAWMNGMLKAQEWSK